ncbi:MAG: protein kinase [Chloroflexi bacterium]|nr:protein kinase [Chloroflexota bacterium]
MAKSNSWIGRKIDHYIIQEHIQRGGMADVFLANDEWLERRAAIKILFPQLSSDPDFVRRFQREAKTVARLRHEHIVQIYTTGVTEDGHHYIAMEYVGGGTLQDKLADLTKQGALLDTPTAIGIVHQIAEALAVAHQAGIVHRDIKPSNVLLREDGTPVLTDLGIAKVSDKPGLTRTDALVGTPAYMSPEQVSNTEVDGRSDIYSLGVIFYELFSGAKLFDGDTPWAILHQHISQEPRPITEIRHDITDTTQLVLQKCLQKDPIYRYQTAAELLHDLDSALIAEHAADQIDTSGHWVGAQPGVTATVLPRDTMIARTPIGLTQPAIPSPTPTPGLTAVTPPQPATQIQEEKKRPSWLIPLLIILLLLICGGAAVALGPLRNTIFPVAQLPPTVPATETPTATDTAVPTVTEIQPTALPTIDTLATVAALEALLNATDIPTPTSEASATPSHTPKPTSTNTADETGTATRTPTAAATLTDDDDDSSSNPTGNASSGSGFPMTFENFGLWVRGDEDNGSFTSSTAQARSGGTAGKISYDFGTSGNDYVVFLQNNSISGTPNALQIWVYGDGSGHFLNAWIRDAGGQTWQVPFGRITHSGWKQMTGHIDTSQTWPWAVISGGSDDAVDYPISFRGFVLDDPNNAYTGKGNIYLDDLTATTLSNGSLPTASAPTPTTGSPSSASTSVPTSAPVDSNGVGRILYTSGNTLLTTDPDWSSPIELGTIASNSCSSPATTVSGQSYNLYFGSFCGVTANGTSVCTSPNGQYEIVSNRVSEGTYSIVIRSPGSESHTFVYQGSLDLNEGIRWSPVSSNYLFIVGDTIHQGFLDGTYNQIISTAFQPYFSPDGSMILYRKPIGPGVNDIFVANNDGSNQRNVTNVSAVDKTCAVWRN